MKETIMTCLNEATAVLESNGVPEARISAETLLSFVLKKPQYKIYLDSTEVVSAEEKNEFNHLVQKRHQRYPLQYLLKTVMFHQATLYVNESCLIPRFETEFLVEVILKEVQNTGERLEILDIGTGSGNIAISLAQARPDWRITATDISESALETAQMNAEINRVDERVVFCKADLWEGLETSRFDLIVSNPPYLTEVELQKLQPEVAFEPALALDGGKDGLDFYRRIAGNASAILRSGGFIFFEVGLGQAGAVLDLLRENNFELLKIYKDYTSIDRVVSGRLKHHG